MPALDTERMAERVEAKEELSPWAAMLPKLERADGSALHRLMTALSENKALWLLAPRGSSPVLNLPDASLLQSFVVQHDWASAFDGATDFDDGDFQLPYNFCCFEFRINGKRVCATIREWPDNPKQISVLVETRGCWIMPIVPYDLKDGKWQSVVADADQTCAALPPFIAAQIRAICISLEADVATAEAVTIEPKLNAARVKRGQQPMPDYHVVKLAHRAERRVGAPHDDDRRKVRLHFRRGHWRRFAEERKTWVHWCLVGDPDLGFIDKQYRL